MFMLQLIFGLKTYTLEICLCTGILVAKKHVTCRCYCLL